MRVLLLSRQGQWTGGVVGFLATFKDFLPPQVELREFVIGRRLGANMLRRLLQPMFDAARLLVHLLTTKVDIVHLNPSLNYKSLLRDGLFMLLVRLCGLGRNTLCFFHGWDESLAERLIDNSVLRFFFLATFGASGRILVLADGFKEQCLRLGVDPKKVHVTTTMFHDEFMRGVNKKEKQEPPVLLFMSRFVKEKGIFELLEAFRELKLLYPGIRLIIAGGGPEENRVEQAVSSQGADAIQLVGYVRGGEKQRVLEEADIFILPTRHGEGCPVSMLEAMAAGLAVVATPVASIPTIIENGKNGVLIDSCRPDLIKNALIELLEQKDFMLSAQQLNKEQAWESYSASSVTQDVVNHYNAIVP